LEKDTTTNKDEAMVEIYKKLRPGEPPTLENARQLIEATFYDNKTI
jgi:DNA-directed RNA polymerase subunit beta